jgi:hypothetical protein
MNGPFFKLLGTTYLLSARTTTTNNHLVGAFVPSGLIPLGGHTPRTHWVPSARRLTLTATMGVVDRIHDNTSNRRPHTAPTFGTGFTQRAQVMLGITHFTQRRPTIREHATHFA